MTIELNNIFNHPKYKTDQCNFLLNGIDGESFEETMEGLKQIYDNNNLSDEKLEELTKKFLSTIEKITK